MIEQGFLDAIAHSPNDVALRLVYADWLMEHGDPRGELLTLWYSPRCSCEEQRRFAWLRGTVSLIPAAHRDMVSDAIATITVTVTDQQPVLARLACVLLQIAHPLAGTLAERALTCPVRATGYAGHSSCWARSVIWNPGGNRWVVTHGSNPASEKGSYPDPLEAALAGLVSVERGPVRLRFGTAFGTVEWPERWRHLHRFGW